MHIRPPAWCGTSTNLAHEGLVSERQRLKQDRRIAESVSRSAGRLRLPEGSTTCAQEAGANELLLLSPSQVEVLEP